MNQLHNAGATVEFSNNNTHSLNFKDKITNQAGHEGTKSVEIMLAIKIFSNFWRKREC